MQVQYINFIFPHYSYLIIHLLKEIKFSKHSLPQADENNTKKESEETEYVMVNSTSSQKWLKKTVILFPIQ